MPLIRVKQNYQVTIPLEVREELRIKLDDLLEATVQNDSIVLTPKVVVDKKTFDEVPKSSNRGTRNRKSL